MVRLAREGEEIARTGERPSQAEMEAQLAQLRSQIVLLQSIAANSSTENNLRVLNKLSKFKRNRGDDVRQWLYQVETLCRIHGHDLTDDNAAIPSISRTAVKNLRPVGYCSGHRALQ
jgi:hypothetical protein